MSNKVIYIGHEKLIDETSMSLKQCCISKPACKVHDILKFHLHLQKDCSTVTEVEDASFDTTHEQIIKTSLSSVVIALG